MSELIFVLSLATGFLILPAIFRQWRLFFVFLTFFVCFGLQEWLSIIQTGHSISQIFWAYDTKHPIYGWIMIIGFIIAWTALLIHFKVHKRKE